MSLKAGAVEKEASKSGSKLIDSSTQILLDGRRVGPESHAAPFLVQRIG